MDAKEKAEKLFITMLSYVSRNQAEQCALIAVDEIMASKPISNSLKYWQEVKQELEKL